MEDAYGLRGWREVNGSWDWSSFRGFSTICLPFYADISDVAIVAELSSNGKVREVS